MVKLQRVVITCMTFSMRKSGLRNFLSGNSGRGSYGREKRKVSCQEGCGKGGRIQILTSIIKSLIELRPELSPMANTTHDAGKNGTQKILGL